jgi:hypothetical protein
MSSLLLGLELEVETLREPVQLDLTRWEEPDTELKLNKVCQLCRILYTLFNIIVVLTILKNNGAEQIFFICSSIGRFKSLLSM